MSTPCKIKALGRELSIPHEYLQLAFLQSTGTQYIDTDFYFNNSQCRIDFQQLVFRNDLHQCMWLFGAKCGLEATCMWGIWSNYVDSTELGWCVENGWTYGLQREAFPIQDMTKRMVWHSGPQGVVICGLHPTWRNYSTLTDEEPNVPYRIFGLARVSSSYINCGCRIWSLEEMQNNKLIHKFVPCLTPTGKPCMMDCISKAAFTNSGDGEFIAGIDNLAQLSALLHKLPTTDGKLTLSLPAEARAPEVAEAMQKTHLKKGWTLIVYEYRPAEVTTYARRRLSEIMWYQRVQCKNGSYVDSTGTRWRIEQCAAIFGPHGQSPATYGYIAFDDLQKALETWSLEYISEKDSIQENF